MVEEEERVARANRERKTRAELAAERLARTKEGDLIKARTARQSSAEALAASRAQALNDRAERAKLEEDDIAKIMSSLEQ